MRFQPKPQPMNIFGLEEVQPELIAVDPTERYYEHFDETWEQDAQRRLDTMFESDRGFN